MANKEVDAETQLQASVDIANDIELDTQAKQAKQKAHSSARSVYQRFTFG